ncbi:MAG: hypothetical protein K2X55_24085 [Burkholderiaceae bacterium]|nr:hypothetical protein [Burkholderiaceae bacterium]
MRELLSKEEQFGTPSENIEAARRRYSSSAGGRQQWHIQVPTRSEVLRLPPDELAALLIGWMERSPVEIIPSAGQIELVIEVMLNRPDASSLAPLIAMCRNFAGSA